MGPLVSKEGTVTDPRTIGDIIQDKYKKNVSHPDESLPAFPDGEGGVVSVWVRGSEGACKHACKCSCACKRKYVRVFECDFVRVQCLRVRARVSACK